MEGLYTANVLGRQRDIYFGMPAIEYVYNNIDTDTFERIGKGEYKVTDIGTIAHFIFAGLQGGADLNGEKLDIRYKDVYALAQSIMFEGDADGVVSASGKAFSESVAVKYLAGKVVKKSKKKSTSGQSAE